MMDDICPLLLNTETPAGPFSDISGAGVLVSQKSYGVVFKYQLIGIREVSVPRGRAATQLLIVGWCQVCGEPFRFTSWRTIDSNLRRTCPQHRGQWQRPIRERLPYTPSPDLETVDEAKEERA